MRPIGYVLLGMLILLSACRREVQRESVNPEPLYRRWQIVERTYANRQPETLTNGGVTEFRPDGTIRYEGITSPCCAPVKVSRNQTVLKPVEIYSGPGCELVDCAGITELRIIHLTEDKLVLEFYLEGIPSMTYTNRYQPAR